MAKIANASAVRECLNVLEPKWRAANDRYFWLRLHAPSPRRAAALRRTTIAIKKLAPRVFELRSALELAEEREREAAGDE